MTRHDPMSRGMEPIPTRPALRFEESARLALANTQLRRNMGKVTQAIRGKRTVVVDEMPDWEGLREAGRAIKERTLRHLDTYLLQLETAVTRAGGQVHWASRRRRGKPDHRGDCPPSRRARGGEDQVAHDRRDRPE